MKPNWKDAPEWANWLAQDEDGTWWWYENEPKSSMTIFYGDGIVQSACINKNWESTKEKRPEPA